MKNFKIPKSKEQTYQEIINRYHSVARKRQIIMLKDELLAYPLLSTQCYTNIIIRKSIIKSIGQLLVNGVRAFIP